MSDEQKKLVRADCKEFAKEVMKAFRLQVFAIIPEDRHRFYEPEIDKWSAAWRDNMDKWIGGLQDDFLFPAFREIFSSKNQRIYSK